MAEAFKQLDEMYWAADRALRGGRGYLSEEAEQFRAACSRIRVVSIGFMPTICMWMWVEELDGDYRVCMGRNPRKTLEVGNA